MNTNLETAILGALYDYRESNPGSPEMTFNELYGEIGVSLSDKKGVGEVRHQLFSLKRIGWVGYESLQDGTGGTVVITPSGAKVIEDSRQTMTSGSDLDIPESPEDRSEELINEADIPTSCPITLEGAIRGHECAGLVQRDDLLQEIKGYFAQNCHFTVLYGESMVGKTKMLRRLSEAPSKEYVPLLVTSQGLGLSALGSLDAFAFDLAHQLTNKFNRWSGHHGFSLSLSVPDRKDFQDGRSTIAFYTHWDDLRRKASDRHPIVMFDEIERLLDHQDQLNPQILTFLDDFVCNPENGYFVIAGSERILDLDNNLLNMLIARGQPIRVRYYNRETVSAVFSAVQSYFVLDSEVLQYLSALCDGHPRFLQMIYQATRSLGKQRLGKNDIGPVLLKVIDLTDPMLRELLRRLTTNERAVVWLISQSGLVDGLLYSLHGLAELAHRLPTTPRVDYDLRIGVDYLEEREWIEWESQEEGSFRFKLGIVPLWVRRRHIPVIS